MGEQLLAGARLADEQHRALAAGHPPQHLLGVLDGVRLADHIVEAVFGVVPLLEQLAAQLVLALLHLVEALQDGEGTDALAAADDRNDLDAQVGPVHLDQPHGQGLGALQALGEGDIGEQLGAALVVVDGEGHAGHILGVLVAGKDHALFIDGDHAVPQVFHQDVELALQADGAGEHLVKAVVAGGDGAEVGLEGLRLQRVVQP